jgi:cytoskeletal protein CcmA (bactofilin family)
MAESDTPPPAEQDDVNALESPDSGGDSNAPAQTSTTVDKPAEPTLPPKPKGLKNKLRRFNIYLLMFVFILVIAGSIVTIAYFQSKRETGSSIIKSQTLTADTLKQVANSDATVGSNGQVLNVVSSAVFAGKVLVREDLEVAGNLKIGGTVGLTNIAVSGTSQLGQVQISKNLAVTGDTAIQGAATISKSLQVNGGGTFNGPLSAPQITTSNLQLNADLVLTRHITTSGGTPGRSNGSALGSGGSASVSGSDTAGTVSINVGSGPSAGCFTTVTFTSKYSSTPHVIITPVGSAAGGLDYYINRTSTNFSICDASAAPAGTSFAFDYFVID